MGSSAVTFSGTVADKSTNDNAHAYTDHPFLYTSAQLTIAPGAAATAFEVQVRFNGELAQHATPSPAPRPNSRRPPGRNVTATFPRAPS